MPAPKVRVRNVGPFGREFPDSPAVVPAGGELDVVPEVAGTAPGPWQPAADGEVPDGHQVRYVPDEAGSHVLAGVPHRGEHRHPGSGLLAQEDVWQLVPAAGKTTTPKEG